MTTQSQGTGFARHFTRITNSGKLIPEIDGLRFIAISAIMLYHGVQQIAARNGLGTTFESHQGIDRALIWLLTQGRLGVQFFFVLSGFVLGQQYAERYHRHEPPPETGKFYLRRLTRLEPPYALNLLLSYGLVATLFTLGLRTKGAGFAELFPHLAASLVYLHSLIYHDMSTVNGVTWSLEIEAQFYLLMPLLAFLIYRLRHNSQRAFALIAVIAGHSLIVSSYAESTWYLDFSLAGYLNYFLTGILLAELHSAHPDWRNGSNPAWDWTALAAFGLILVSEAFLHYEAQLPVLFAVIFQAALCGRFLKGALRYPPVWIVGGMCYSIYLYHLWILGLGAQALRFAYRHDHAFWVNFSALFPILLLFVLTICAGFYVLVERPCMKRDWPERLLRRMGLKA